MKIYHKLIKAIFCLKFSVTRIALFKYRVACTSEHSKIIKLLNPDVVIDIGANRGQFSLLARALYPKVKIYCYEPLTSEFFILKSIFKNDKNIICNQHAVGEKISSGIIHIAQKHDSSSLLPISKLQNKIFPGTEEISTEIVNIFPLTFTLSESILEGCVLMKIDVQGYEYAVLLGCISLFPKITYIYIELSYVELYEGQKQAAEVLSVLQAEGYMLIGVFNTTYTSKGVAIQSDFLLSR